MVHTCTYGTYVYERMIHLKKRKKKEKQQKQSKETLKRNQKMRGVFLVDII